MAREIKDFGEKIGGARKDFYAVALNANDLKDMNDAEKKKYVKRDSIWKRENAADLIAAGMPRETAYWRNEMRLCMHTRPIVNDEEYIERYITVIGKMRDLVQNITTPEQQRNFFQEAFTPDFLERTAGGYKFRPETIGIFLPKIYNIADYSADKLKRDSKYYGMSKEESLRTTADELIVIGVVGENVTVSYDRARVMATYRIPGGARFFYTDQKDLKAEEFVSGTSVLLDGLTHRIAAFNCTKEEAAEKKTALIQKLADKAKENNGSTKRKKAFPIPQITNVRRTGPKLREDSVIGEDLIETFHIRGGEFGKWMSDADAAESINKCYDALADLGRILDISPESLSFHGKLAIGFGSRGHSAAAAHYEPARQVINLTKYRGQGSLCHEWAHALDHAIGQHYGCREFASLEADRMNHGKLPKIFRDLAHAMAYKTVLVTEEEILKQKEKRIHHLKSLFTKKTGQWKSKYMTKEDAALWDKTVAELWETGNMDLVDVLSGLRKAAVGRVIPKSHREDIIWYVQQSHIEEPDPKKTKKVRTDFSTGSQKFDDVFTKMGHGYWQSWCEMFARAFDCYISDKLKERGEENTYLTYGADSYVLDLDGVHYAAVPEEEERETLNKLFDELIDFLKEEKIL